MDTQLDEDIGPYLGEVKPQYGRWTWPFSWMKEGEYFHVDHARRNPEDVRVYVSVRAAQLNKRFSVKANDPERPGYCRVTCVPRGDAADEPKCIALDYLQAKQKLREWYGWDVGKLDDMVYGENKGTVAKVKQIAQPPVERIMFPYAPWTLGAILRPDEIEFVSFEEGATPDSWKHEEPFDKLEDIFA